MKLLGLLMFISAGNAWAYTDENEDYYRRACVGTRVPLFCRAILRNEYMLLFKRCMDRTRNAPGARLHERERAEACHAELRAGRGQR